MDRITALILILIISPLLLLCLLISFINFKCNPIFTQQRTVDGRFFFTFYKIRSMYKAAPNIPTNEFKNPETFISPWGSFMRMHSIDELLNLICIVRGDMKFIGPRPILAVETELILLRRRNSVNCKAGITGLAQISGRDDITINRKVACERYYNHKRTSFFFRVFLITKTFQIVLKGTGIKH